MVGTQLLRDVLNLCLPAACAACTNAATTNTFLCPTCDGSLLRLERAPACPRCAMPLAERGAPCPYCRGKGVPHFEHVAALGKFDDPIKHLVHQMKYRRRWTIADHLGQRLAASEQARPLLANTDCLLPVPLHRFRRINRGFNQADLIAQAIGRVWKLPVVRPVRRVRNTETQTHLHSRERRIENLRGAFRLRRPRDIESRRVLVIDDVMTSGATLQTLARALSAARPTSMSALVVAIADPRGRQFQGI